MNRFGRSVFVRETIVDTIAITLLGYVLGLARLEFKLIMELLGLERYLGGGQK